MKHLSTSYSTIRGCILTLLLLGLICPGLRAQIQYKPGYYIDNEGVRHEAFILNINKNDNPDQFSYKRLENGPVLVGSVREVKEYGVDDMRYRRYTALIPSLISNSAYQEDRPLDYDQADVFMKVLARADDILLLGLTSGNKNWYYHATEEDDTATFLLYKEFLRAGYQKPTSDNYHDYLHKSRQYRNQIYQLLKDKGITEEDALAAEYNQKDLVGLWQKATGEVPVVKREKLWNLSLFARGGVVRTTVHNSFYSKTILKGVPTWTAGFDIEKVFPFLNNKLSVGVSPQYQRILSDHAATILDGEALADQTGTIDVHSIEFPLSLRYRMYISESSWFYLRSGVGYFITLEGSHLVFPAFSTMKDLETGNGTTLFMDLGYQFNRHLGAGFTYKRHNNLRADRGGFVTVGNEIDFGLSLTF